MAEARALIVRPEHPDWFMLTGEALIELSAGRPEHALPLLERAGFVTALPRLLVASSVLSAAALARRGMHEASAARLDAVWNAHPAPRLLRFALRFLDAEAFAALTVAAHGEVVPGVAEALRAAAGDKRPADSNAAPTLTAAEKEILVLLRRGLGNAEIAQTRGVSHNTIRTQLRLLYRKLGAANRSEAIANAERAELLDTTGRR